MKNNEENMASKEIEMPKYVTLEQKYNCDKCKLNRYNSRGTFAKCYGKPSKRMQCIKRCWPFSLLFNIVTGIIIAVAFILIYSKLKDLLLSLAYTVIFMVGMDIISCLIGFVMDKIFEKIEKARENNYEKKVENLRILKKQQEEEKYRQTYKEISEAEELFFRLSNEYLENLKNAINKSQIDKDNKKDFLKKYKNFLKSIEELLGKTNTKDFYLSEIKVLFQIHLPKLEEYIAIYIDAIETGKASESQRQELTKLLEAFTERIIWIKENLNKAEAENLVYKMQALREVIHIKEDNE